MGLECCRGYQPAIMRSLRNISLRLSAYLPRGPSGREGNININSRVRVRIKVRVI